MQGSVTLPDSSGWAVRGAGTCLWPWRPQRPPPRLPGAPLLWDGQGGAPGGSRHHPFPPRTTGQALGCAANRAPCLNEDMEGDLVSNAQGDAGTLGFLSLAPFPRPLL